MKERYIRFMAQVQPLSIQKLATFVDGAVQNGAEKIHLLIDTEGGNIQSGVAIYGFLKRASVEVVTYNLGSVHSIGVVMYCAGNERVTVPYANFYLHRASGVTQGDADNSQTHARMLLQQEDAIATIIAQTIEKSKDEIAEKMKVGTVLNSESALDMRLATKSSEDTIIKSGVDYDVIKATDAFPPQTPLNSDSPIPAGNSYISSAALSTNRGCKT